MSWRSTLTCDAASLAHGWPKRTGRASPACGSRSSRRNSLLDGVIHQQGALALGEHDLELAASIQQDQALLDEQRLELHHLRYDTEQLRAEVAARAVSIEADREKLVLAQGKLAELEAKTEALRQQQAAHYEDVQANQAATQQLIDQQRREAAQLGKRIKTLLTKERHSGRLPSAYNGTFRWPINGNISGFITQEFGCTGFFLEPPYGNCAHFHKGIDIAAPEGTPVVAAGPGVVLFVGYDPDTPRAEASFSVVIAHSDHLVTYYGHLLPRIPRHIHAGVEVRSGQKIGWEGNTGNSTGPHLHWGVYVDGAPRNPRYFL